MTAPDVPLPEGAVPKCACGNDLSDLQTVACSTECLLNAIDVARLNAPEPVTGEKI